MENGKEGREGGRESPREENEEEEEEEEEGLTTTTIVPLLRFVIRGKAPSSPVGL